MGADNITHLFDASADLTWEDTVEILGHPDMNGDMKADESWFSNNMMLCELPYEMRPSWNLDQTISRQYINMYVANRMIASLVEICHCMPQKYLRVADLDLFGGLFNVRLMRGSSNLYSFHTLGVAIDIVPHLGPLHGKNNVPEFMRGAFERNGFTQLKHDGMHFQPCGLHVY